MLTVWVVVTINLFNLIIDIRPQRCSTERYSAYEN